jgi:hypothetical protein
MPSVPYLKLLQGTFLAADHLIQSHISGWQQTNQLDYTEQYHLPGSEDIFIQARH